MEAGADPLVMYLVVRRRTQRPFADLAVACARATRRCAARYRADDRWRDGFDDWWSHSFRKVCLRAEPREWEALRLLDHERVGDVACLPPVRRSSRDPVLRQMQTLTDAAGFLPELADESPAEGLTLAVANELGMSAGKTLAQVGHGALMAGFDDDAGRSVPIHVVGVRRETWAHHAPAAAAIVRDGGLTEIAAGSETVLVLWKSERPGGRIGE